MKAFIFLLSSLPYLSHSQKICYNPNHYQSSQIPCDPGAVVSACCDPGDTCATNLYCISLEKANIVGHCTDKTFTDPACPWPLNATTASTNFDHFDYKLNTTTCQDRTICPSDDPRCCSEGRGKVEVLFHYNAPIPTANKDLASYYSAASYTTINLATTSQKNTLSATTILATSATSTSTSPITSPDPSGLASSSKPPNRAIKPGVWAAIGIAIALSLSLLLVIIICSRRYRRRRDRNYPEISSHKLNVRNEYVATPDDEIATAVRSGKLSELPDSGRVMATELDVSCQTRGAGFGLAEIEGQIHTGDVGVPNRN